MTTTTTYPLAQPSATTLRLAVWDYPEGSWDGPRLLAASLWRVHQPSGRIIPLLATDAEPQPATLEGDVWIVEVPIRAGVTWSDCVPVTIDDIIFTAQQNAWPATVEGSDEGVRLSFSEPVGWAGFMADIGLQALLPSHYWAPLIALGFEPGTSWAHDIAAPSAASHLDQR